jgi:predicted ATPase/DNA-binding NarL/FixJ family response regulator
VPLTSFIGREPELDRLRRYLGSTRLLTLTGAPGIGKTRLALEAAAGQWEEFVDGIRFIPVAAIRDPELVLAAIAQAAGVEASGRGPLLDRLAEALRDRRCLLVLDNFEQVVAAGPLLSQILEACPRLCVLVTSRTRLGVRGEREFGVRPLALPDVGQHGTNHVDAVSLVMRSEAGRLFAERAREALPGFAITRENARCIADICRRLDGLPLALELAASWVRMLSLPVLRARLTNRLEFLRAGPTDLPPRQQTLRDAIAWSYDLLSGAEQRLFQRLAVFAGGFTFPAAEAIAEAALPALKGLLDASLVQRVGGPADAEPRFGMLETIRDYARERLAASGEADSLRRRHAAYFLALAEAAQATFHAAGEREALDRLEAAHENLRAALRFLLDQADAEQAFRLGSALQWLWTIRGHVTEARWWLARLLELGRAAARVKDQADLLRTAGRMAHKQSDHAESWPLLEESLALARQIGNRRGVAESLSMLGLVARYRGDYPLARSLSEESLEIYREIGDCWGIGTQLERVGIVAYCQGDVASARALVEESLAVRRQAGDQIFIAYSLAWLGVLAHGGGDHAAARSHYEACLAIWREHGYRAGIAEVVPCAGDLALDEGDLPGARSLLVEGLELGCALAEPRWMIGALEGLAGLAATQHDAARCLRLAGAASAFREAIGEPCRPDRHARLARRLASARQMLEEKAAAIAWEQGRAMSRDRAIAYALDKTTAPAMVEPPKPHSAITGPPDGLTPREHDVVRLVAEGLTNRRIAERLVISERTVGTHVANILGKLGFATRAQIAAWAAQRSSSPAPSP